MTYIVCERDQVLAPAVPERLAADADPIERLPSSHQPMFSLPDAPADVLDRAR
ncbi:hypothetical protein ACVGVM_24820 [Pseudonocardia bannensis]|uniref:hypothetical protein n=1 Tax=Pseudonocardia bannensis TaxID=630973 RepID=UPI001B7D274E|nr:hypothetical protein [Pseudonocardia bannensis]